MLSGHESWGWHVPELARAHGLPCLQLVRGNPVRGILEGAYPAPAAARLLAELRKAALLVAPAQHMASGLGGPRPRTGRDHAPGAPADPADGAGSPGAGLGRPGSPELT